MTFRIWRRIFAFWNLVAISQSSPVPQVHSSNLDSSSPNLGLDWNGMEASENDINLKQLDNIAKYMDKQADPCQNFHQYACGNWRTFHPNGTSMMKVGNEKVTNNFVRLFESQRNTLDTNNHPENDLIHQKLLKYYSICKDLSTEDRLPRIEDYVTSLEELGFRRMWNSSWLEVIAELGRYGHISHYLQVQVKQVNASTHLISVEAHNHNEHVELNQEVFKILQRSMSQSWDFGWLNQSFNHLEVSLKEKILPTTCKENNVDSDECDLSEFILYKDLSKRIPQVNWIRFFEMQYEGQPQPMDMISVDDVETIVKICRFLNDEEAISKELLFLYSMARFLNYLQQQPYSILQTGASLHNCVNHMRKTLFILMNYVYEMEYYAPIRPQSDEIIHSIFANLKSEFSQILSENKFNLSMDGLDYMKTKLDTLRLNIGNLPENVSYEFYLSTAKSLEVRENFFVNHLLALKHTFDMQRSRSQLRDNSNSPWQTFNYHFPNMPNNLDTTPYYYTLSNAISIPNAYLQMPFYDWQFWPTLLYGDLANTLGHELIHAFDTNFLQYDHFGNLSNMSRTIDENVHIQRNIQRLKMGTFYLNERIADIGGSRLAMNAFLKDIKVRRLNETLYFLQFAQFFCGSADSDTFHIEDPLHDIDSIRLNYTIANLPEFSEIFNCPVGSPMNAKEKIHLW